MSAKLLAVYVPPTIRLLAYRLTQGTNATPLTIIEELARLLGAA